VPRFAEWESRISRAVPIPNCDRACNRRSPSSNKLISQQIDISISHPGCIETDVSDAELVDTFYNLVTDVYEWGWGQSFHFSPLLPGNICSAQSSTLPAYTEELKERKTVTLHHPINLNRRNSKRFGGAYLQYGCSQTKAMTSSIDNSDN
jgi:hypothetical protein